MVKKLDKIMMGTWAVGTVLTLGGYIVGEYYNSRLSQINDSPVSINQAIRDPFNYQTKIQNSESICYAGIGAYSLASILGLGSFLVKKR